MRPERRRAFVTPASRPRLRRHVRLQFDPVRNAWALLSPERVFWPDEVSLDILRRCDGQATMGEMVSALAAEYDADEREVAADVTAFLQEWTDNLLVTL
ncbi:pyrroloquinoline quinone biosynthesis peptide chaperone PqqD [Aquamicrobium sp. LC103]|uniref:pyrroloquinoline quinone biosynthesis peptide chaperone PqqD n=1 Tax=Aquamicrobium sp. LC103 TaxID=1120658 RepID=UPI00063E7858|nr:pyrroloquinoline quinone biosynthesis peptide chaperone PqqD [Aquamicrobium sp. LC103]TKT76292.1 pyrroloquinoline quinone biosynthesis peptide chaperone PqqD [Aquamicrobium sp. LC103]